MANKTMGMMNVGSDTYELVDIAGRQATGAVDAKVDELSASNLPYSNGVSTKQKIDDVESNKLNITDAKNWTGPITLANFTGITALGYYNAALKLAYIKINGSSSTPTESGKQVSISDGRFIPLSSEAFGFMRYGGYFWIDENYHLTFSSINTSQAWQNGYMLYPTRS